MSLLGGLVSVGLGIWGSSKSSSAAKTQVDLQNQAIDAQYEYDVEAWEMQKQAANAKRDFAILQIQEKARQEELIAAYKDATNLRQYNYNLQIRNREQDLNDRMYNKSEDIYSQQLGINAREERSARMDERRQMKEIDTENRYQQNDVYLEALEAEGAIRARGITGRTADKLKSAEALKASTKLSLLDMSLDNATEASKSTLRAIGEQRTVADLNAFAARMLQPGELPMPIVPIETPQATFIYPRVYEDFDFGPEPIKGAKASASAASAQVWGSTISSLAGTVGNMFATNTPNVNSLFG